MVGAEWGVERSENFEDCPHPRADSWSAAVGCFFSHHAAFADTVMGVPRSGCRICAGLAPLPHPATLLPSVADVGNGGCAFTGGDHLPMRCERCAVREL